jgi:hypothetical protein
VKLADMKKLRPHLRKRKPRQEVQPALKVDDASPQVTASDGSGANNNNKRKAAAMEQEGGLPAPPDATKPRLSSGSSSSSLAVET